MRALIVEHGSNRGSLAAARALHSAGWTVDIVASGDCLTVRSRRVRRRELIRYPNGGAEELMQAVRRVIRDAGIEIVFPVDETQLLVLSRHRDELNALLPYPPHEVVERATDRLEQARAAERAGLAPPPTAEGESTDLSDREGLVVVKARTPTLLPLPNGWGRIEARVGTPREAASWISELQTTGARTVVQDVLQGHLASMTVLTDAEGQLIAQVQQAAGRLWPPGAGTSVRASTTPVDAELSQRVLTFLEDLGWRGFAQLQFIVDADGVPHLIDFNPRFYGSLALAIRSGVNFPVIWAALATGRAHSCTTSARVGVRYHWLGGDLRWILQHRPGAFIRDVGQSLAWGLAAVHPIWSVRDPNPATHGAMTSLRRRLRPGPRASRREPA
jgi:predicted ATP-grasp superfamily ATP-dependent carboligase